jgi:hypothetical protein
LAKDAVVCPVRDAILYVPATPLGGRGKGFQGETFYVADNPPFGATFTYHLKDALKSKKQKRKDAERAAAKKDAPPPYPTKDELRAEAEEEEPAILLTVTDAESRVVRTLTGSTGEGLHRVTWDLREHAPTLATPRAGGPPDDDDDDAPRRSPGGPLVMPGKYTVQVAKRVEGKTTPLGEPREFEVVGDGVADLPPEVREELGAFNRQVMKLQKALAGTTTNATDLAAKLEQMKRALDQASKADPAAQAKVRSMIDATRAVLRALNGDSVLRSRNENVPTSIAERVRYVAGVQRQALQRPTGTQRESYRIAGDELARELAKLRTLIEKDLPALEKALDAAGAPATPGRLPDWKQP